MVPSSRCFLPIANSVDPSAVSHFLKLVQYNILADGEKLALSNKHGYCPIELRVWGSAQDGRCLRLLQELQHYNADVICLQELKLEPFSTDFLPVLRDRGYDGVHISSVSGQKPLRSDSMLANATFFRTDAYTLEAVEGVLYRTLVQKDLYPRKIRERLMKLDDSVLISLLKHRRSGRQVVVANTHLFWDPNWPHVKAIQAGLACKAINDFIQQRGFSAPPFPPPTILNPSSGRPAPPSTSTPAVSNPSSPSIPVIFCGDLNSVPHMNREFLPASQRAWFDPLVTPPPAPPSPTPTPVPPAPATAAAATAATAATTPPLCEGAHNGGVVQLLSSGRLLSVHPEHPDTFGKTVAPSYSAVTPAGGDAGAGGAGTGGAGGPGTGASTSTGAPPPPPATGKADKAAKPKKSKNRAVVAGDLTTAGLALYNAHEELRGGVPVRLTTRVEDFSGALDYVWATGDAIPTAILQMPYEEEVITGAGGAGVGGGGGSEEGAGDIGKGEGEDSRSRKAMRVGGDDVVVGATPVNRDTVNLDDIMFPSIPNEAWPSDHLAMGVTFAFLSESSSDDVSPPSQAAPPPTHTQK